MQPAGPLPRSVDPHQHPATCDRRCCGHQSKGGKSHAIAHGHFSRIRDRSCIRRDAGRGPAGEVGHGSQQRGDRPRRRSDPNVSQLQPAGHQRCPVGRVSRAQPPERRRFANRRCLFDGLRDTRFDRQAAGTRRCRSGAEQYGLPGLAVGVHRISLDTAHRCNLIVDGDPRCAPAGLDLSAGCDGNPRRDGRHLRIRLAIGHGGYRGEPAR